MAGGAARDDHHALEPPPHRVQVGVLFCWIDDVNDEDVLDENYWNISYDMKISKSPLGNRRLPRNRTRP